MAGLFKVKVVTNYAGQDMLNRYWYVDLGLGLAEDLAKGIVDTIIPAHQAICSTAVTFKAVTVENVQGVVEDIHTEQLENLTGNITGDTLPSHDTWSFSLQRSSRTLRSGRKAIGGVPESKQVNGQPISGFLGDLQRYADAVQQVLVTGLLTDYNPVLVRELGGLHLWTNIAGSAFKRLSTQNSRKGYTNSTVSLSSAGTVRSVDFSIETLGDVYGAETQSNSWSSLPEGSRLSPFGYIDNNGEPVILADANEYNTFLQSL